MGLEENGQMVAPPSKRNDETHVLHGLVESLKTMLEHQSEALVKVSESVVTTTTNGRCTSLPARRRSEPSNKVKRLSGHRGRGRQSAPTDHGSLDYPCTETSDVQDQP